MKFSGSYESLPAISDFVRRIASEAGLNEDDVYAVELAVDEACTNIIEHAYANQKTGEIVCSCEAVSGGMEIVLTDTGKEFNPEGIPEPDPSLPIEKISARGAGLYLMRKMMDEIKFDYDPNQGNTLRMLKKKSTGK